MKSLILCAALITGLLTGCKTTPDVAAFKTLTATQITVEQALSLWDSFLVIQKDAGKPVSIATERKVKSAYERYQKAALVMVDAGQAWTKARKLGDEATAKSLYDLAVTSAGQAKADLFALLESFGVSLTH